MFCSSGGLAVSRLGFSLLRSVLLEDAAAMFGQYHNSLGKWIEVDDRGRSVQGKCKLQLGRNVPSLDGATSRLAGQSQHIY